MCKKPFIAVISMLLIAVILCVPLSPVHAQQDFDVKVDSAILVDAKTGQVLFEKNAYERKPPASLTKLMSTLLFMEYLENGSMTLEDNVTISYRASKTEGSKIWLNQGDIQTVHDLLEAVIVTSANDATVALAEYVAGTEGNFVRLMNRKAEELGLENTVFDNATGLPVNGEGIQYVSAYDIAVISRELIKYPEVLEWSSEWAISIRGEWRANTNRSFLQSFDGANGLKTGWTTEAKFCVSASAERGNMHLIAVIMGAETEEQRGQEASKLLDYGFRRFDTVTVAQQDVVIDRVEILNGIPEKAAVVPLNDLTVLVAKGRQDKVVKGIVLDSNVSAPLAAGEHIGVIRAYDGEILLGEETILVKEEIKKANLFTVLIRKARNFFMSLFKQ